MHLNLHLSVSSFSAAGVSRAFGPAVKAGSDVHSSDTLNKTLIHYHSHAHIHTQLCKKEIFVLMRPSELLRRCTSQVKGVIWRKKITW